MTDVAREMGVAHGSLYNYVESKEALFLLLVEQWGRIGADLRDRELPIKTSSIQEHYQTARAAHRRSVSAAVARCCSRAETFDRPTSLNFVRAFERLSDLPRDGHRVVNGKRPLRKARGEVVTLDQFHHERAVLEPVNLRDIGMVERGQRLRFTDETLQPVLIDTSP
jgi:AcrR family transcriptional regulator